ncbi:type I-B CRISPR-associated protein Cas8b1/Cst1 [Marinitoga aeolica]|uniref:Type I-B CRISPR-associated protein Cas8b1/Cst1 n=1 Tax=Marinitoga aeolica TaxID=2809031 RepID=A0ABY8PRR2_9BACT|nr:type I-B CRISPR-associated protein Cas8b1/Cst1 [Marinitoga aeolica]WGS65320.1 type I-B CRISPR-associated protein Cas8b1/Cst1 [Marinitoga aeolica]
MDKLKENYITLRLSDWLYNAGIVGLINILGEDNVRYRTYEENLDMEYDEIEIKIEAFENFEEKYFDYFINTYKNLNWHQLISYKEIIEQKIEQNQFSKEDIEIINKIIKSFKDNLKKASFKSAYNLIYKEINNFNFLEEIKKIKRMSKLSTPDEIRDNLLILKNILDFLEKPVSKKYIAAKNAMYSVIRNAWDGVSFLNPQTKEKDMYVDYKKYFLEPFLEYLKLENDEIKKYKYTCFSCNRPMKKLETNMSFLKNIGFDDARKPSNVWNFINDTYICPICKLVYSCIPAGFTYVYDKGLFVNLNHSVEDIYNINKRVMMETYNDSIKEYDKYMFSYKTLLSSIYENLNKTTKYEYSDIQIVKLENEKYYFNILSKKILLVLKESSKLLNELINNYYYPTKKGDYKDKVMLYEEAIFRITNNIELYDLINDLLRIKLSDKTNGYYSIRTINNLIKINLNYLSEVKDMKDFNESEVKQANYYGYLMRQYYLSKGSEHKLSGISYKLLNALKVNNKDSFMDTLLNCYLYVDKPVPKIIIEALDNNDIFKSVGYAYIAGLFGEYKKGDENNG